MTEKKYPMPALTEQQREDAIRFNKEIIDQCEAYAITVGAMDDNVQSLVMNSRITLAALTAEPDWWICSSVELPPKTPIGYRNDVPDAYLCCVETVGGRPMYPAPPVPLMKDNHAAIVSAAEKLVRCKGRYHSEHNYRALAALFGVTVPVQSKWPDCSNAGFGTYDGCVTLTTPDGKVADIDACIASEVVYLWQLGVKTIESCCGHGKAASYIAVDQSSIDKMIGMGYVPEDGRLVDGIFTSKTSRHGVLK